MTVEAAITKIQTEVNSNEKDGNVQLVGNFLIRHVQENPLDAEKIIVEKKTIKGSVGEIKKISKNGATDPLTGFNAVLKYFEIEKEFTMDYFFGALPAQQSNQPVASSEQPKSTSFSTNLEDYL